MNYVLRKRIRVCDGTIQAIYERIKEKALTVKSQLKKLPVGKKILLIISKILKALAIGFGANSAVAAARSLADLKGLTKELKLLADEPESKKKLAAILGVGLFGVISSIKTLAILGISKLAERLALKGSEWEQ